MITLKIISVILCWIYYSYLEGRREAFYYDALTSSRARHPNLHLLFALQRMVVLVFCLSITDYMYATGLVFIFPFFHDGVYYVERNKLNPNIYLKGFWDDSTTSTAFFEIGIALRVLMLIFGLIILTLHLILK